MRGKHGNHTKGPKNARWNDGMTKSSHGYLKVNVGTRHPLADPNGYAYVHLLVWCSTGKQRPVGRQNIHHRNDMPTDNRIENLELIDSSEHMCHHMAGYQYEIAICHKCKQPVSSNWMVSHLKSGCVRGISRKVSRDPGEWPGGLAVQEYPKWPGEKPVQIYVAQKAPGWRSLLLSESN